ncbi:MAG: TolC family protein, partial [Phycisphaerales bacterium]
MTGKEQTIRLFITRALLLYAVLALTGCTPFPGGEKYYEITTPPEKVRQIETLQLEKAETQDEARIDANDVTPDQLELTLEQCRAMALQNNLELKVQLISPAIAAESVSIEEARFETAFRSNVSYVKSNTPVPYTLDIAGSRVDYFQANLGVDVPLRTGTTVTFNVADQRTETDSAWSTFNPSYGSDLSVSISQPLLRNAGKRVNTYGIRIAEYERQITDARTKLEVIRVIAALDRVYWRLYAARRELEVRKQQYDLAQTQLEQARRFVNEGERAYVEVVRAEAGVAQQLEAIILAENSLRDRERELKRVLSKAGLDMQSATVLIPGTEPDPVRYEPNRAHLVKLATDSRMEMLELQLQIAEDMSTIGYARNQMLPLVTLDYTYNINGLGATRSDAFDLLFTNEFADHRLGLQLLVPLGNEAAKSRLLQAFYQRRQRLATRENRRAMIEFEVLNAVDQVEANWQRILASRQRAILDGRLFEAEKRQYALGMRTTTEVLQAQTTFADAQSAEILALTEYQIAL